MFRRTFAALVLLAALASGQTLDRARVDATVEEAMRFWGVPGTAVAIVRGDEVLVARGYGVKEIGKSDPVTAHTLFAIGSMTKAFTTACMAMLVDEGKMSWDDPVRKHIEFFHLSDPLADEMVTLRDLICHRTGLSRHDILWHYSPSSSEEIIRKVAFLKPTRQFRSAWQYNNIMFLTAGYAVGKAAGMPWADFVERRIFGPLGMTGADCSTTAAEKSPDRSSPHVTAEGKTRVIPWVNIDNIQPAGAINASVDDLAKWARFQLGDGSFGGKRLISARNMAEMHTPQMAIRPEDWASFYTPDTHQVSYAMGWGVEDYRGVTVISHGGSIDGFRSVIALVPQQKIGIVVLSNVHQVHLPEALHWSLIDLVLGLAARDWNAIVKEHFKEEQPAAVARVPHTKPSRELSAYAGEYTEPAYGTAKVSVDGGRLVLAWSTFRTPLEHFHFDVFQSGEERLGKPMVQFRLGVDGGVRSMEFLGVEFARQGIRPAR